MIDLHTHFLNGIDDGAQTLEESLALARAAVADGIVACAVTPHIHHGRFENQKTHIALHVEAFRLTLKEQSIPLQVYMGAEVRLSVEALEQILQGEVPFLGAVNGCQIMLLELPHEHMPVGTLQFVNKLLGMNIRPLIAHPERNKAIMADPRKVLPLVDAGCWLQVTGGSITGDFGTSARKTALHLLDEGLVHIVASDAHNIRSRPPVLSRARAAVAERMGEDVAQLMFHTRPARIVGFTS
jgi:protein-tyrosine phosphatase